MTTKEIKAYGDFSCEDVLQGHDVFINNVKSRLTKLQESMEDAIAVSRDHKPDQTDERQRIEDAGGFVTWAGTWRVGGVLAVSREFGDILLKQYVVADPEIQVRLLSLIIVT
ncbi:uncharacterized protein A4U43_C06F17790 [Asparagus officinalis]|uniref:protein-serine/threonine phosphatase n=1 Tax=Asparagus officinalis TaxID=4686 RepID=A0A5P1EQZ2_ASPOF|nr:uncharacterized protein A4U43_C06F17790 [Asparagus officinalis]